MARTIILASMLVLASLVVVAPPAAASCPILDGGDILHPNWPDINDCLPDDDCVQRPMDCIPPN